MIFSFNDPHPHTEIYKLNMAGYPSHHCVELVTMEPAENIHSCPFHTPKKLSPDMVVCYFKFQRKTKSQNGSGWKGPQSGCFRAVPAPMLRRSVLEVREIIFLMTALEENFKTTKEQNRIIEIFFLH